MGSVTFIWSGDLSGSLTEVSTIGSALISSAIEKQEVSTSGESTEGLAKGELIGIFPNEETHTFSNEEVGTLGNSKMHIGPLRNFHHDGKSIGYYFETLQQWEGKVTDLAENEFTAVLRSLSSDISDKRVTIEKEEISNSDQALV